MSKTAQPLVCRDRDPSAVFRSRSDGSRLARPLRQISGNRPRRFARYYRLQLSADEGIGLSLAGDRSASALCRLGDLRHSGSSCAPRSSSGRTVLKFDYLITDAATGRRLSAREHHAGGGGDRQPAKCALSRRRCCLKNWESRRRESGFGRGSLIACGAGARGRRACGKNSSRSSPSRKYCAAASSKANSWSV